FRLAPLFLLDRRFFIEVERNETLAVRLTRQRAADAVHEVVEPGVLALLKEAQQPLKALSTRERPIAFDRFKQIKCFRDALPRQPNVAAGGDRVGKAIGVVGEMDPAVVTDLPNAAIEIDRDLALRFDSSRLAFHGRFLLRGVDYCAPGCGC